MFHSLQLDWQLQMTDYADRHIIGIEWFWQTVKTSAVCATKTITASNLKSFLFVFLEYTTNAFYNNFFCKIGFSLFIEYIAIKKKYVLRYGAHTLQFASVFYFIKKTPNVVKNIDIDTISIYEKEELNRFNNILKW